MRILEDAGHLVGRYRVLAMIDARRAPRTVWCGIVSRAVSHLVRFVALALGPVPGWYMLFVERFAIRSTAIVQVFSSGARFELDLSEFVQRKFYFRSYERRELKFIRATLDHGDVFIDIGANVGLLSLCAAQSVGTTGQVLAIEPDPVNVQRFDRNLELNPGANVKIVPVAVGASHGIVRLGMPTSEAAMKNSGARSRSSSENQIEVEQVTIDEAVARALPTTTSVQLVKLDVEGMELDVLRGGPTLFDGAANCVMLEVNERYDDGATAVTMLGSLGYEVFRLGPFARLRTWSPKNSSRTQRFTILHRLPGGIGQWLTGETRLTTAVAVRPDRIGVRSGQLLRLPHASSPGAVA
jgi:FkbM family methyltransferase